MKRISIIITFLVISSSLFAQTADEILRQDKTQKKYLIKQILLLKSYAESVKRGLRVVQFGWTAVENIKNGEFNLHRDFFANLSRVNPHISNAAKVADIIAFEVYVIREIKRLNDFCTKTKYLTPHEARYVSDVYLNFLQLTDASIAELNAILFPGKLQMSDDQRIAKIDAIHIDMRDKSAFVQSFGNDVRFLVAQRKKDEQAILRSQKLNNL